MLDIQKGQEPKILGEFRARPGVRYDDLDHHTKSEILEALLKEQFYLCAYCMSRITTKNAHIEHWYPQSTHPEHDLSYPNLLAVCSGNSAKGVSEKDRYCDTRRGNQPLQNHPANAAPAVQERIKYQGGGEILSDDVTLNRELNVVLNLNYKRLKSNRKEVLEGLKYALSRMKGYDRTQIQRLLTSKSQARAGKKAPYLGVITYYLEKKLRRIN